MESFPDISKEFNFITGAVTAETHELTNETIQDFLMELGIVQYYDHLFPFTNFYVTKPELWNRHDVRELLKQFANHKLSADCRWGDIPIIGLTLKYKIHWNHLKECDVTVKYYHASHNGEIQGGHQTINEVSK